MSSRFKRFGIVSAMVGLVVLASCTAGQVRSNLKQVDQKIEAADKAIEKSQAVVATIEPTLAFLPETQRAQAEEALRLARETITGYQATKVALEKTRDELLEKLKDAKDEDSATWATIGTVASNAVSAIFSPGGLLAVGISLVTGIGGLIKGKKSAEKDTKTIVNAIDVLRSDPTHGEAVQTAMVANKGTMLAALSPRAWELIQDERTT